VGPRAGLDTSGHHVKLVSQSVSQSVSKNFKLFRWMLASEGRRFESHSQHGRFQFSDKILTNQLHVYFL
jgi:hypothetical protein